MEKKIDNSQRLLLNTENPKVYKDWNCIHNQPEVSSSTDQPQAGKNTNTLMIYDCRTSLSSRGRA